MSIESENERVRSANIKVVGVGGAGGMAVGNMIAANLKGLEFIVVDTNVQALGASLAPVKIQIGANITGGPGSVADTEIARHAAVTKKPLIKERLKGAYAAFITAGMGGGTGTGAAPVIAKIAKELGALTIAVVTNPVVEKPFTDEAEATTLKAMKGLRELKNNVDMLLVLPVNRMPQDLSMKETFPDFGSAAACIKQAVQGISDIILAPGLIGIDLVDLKKIMQDSGRAVMGIGTGKGKGGMLKAAKDAISKTLSENSSIKGALGILCNIKGNLDTSLNEVLEVGRLLDDSAGHAGNTVFGIDIKANRPNEVEVTIIATGFEAKDRKFILQ